MACMNHCNHGRIPSALLMVIVFFKTLIYHMYVYEYKMKGFAIQNSLIKSLENFFCIPMYSSRLIIHVRSMKKVKTLLSNDDQTISRLFNFGEFRTWRGEEAQYMSEQLRTTPSFSQQMSFKDFALQLIHIYKRLYYPLDQLTRYFWMVCYTLVILTLPENTYFPCAYVFPNCLNENTQTDPECFIEHLGQEVNTR